VPEECVLGAKLYRPRRNDVFVGQDTLRDHAHTIATQQLIPRIAKQNQIAVETVRVPVYFYSRIRGGRRCSCADIEVSGGARCAVCYGTLTVGGYEKYGTHTEVFDVTREARAMNVLVDNHQRTQPRHYILVDGARAGYVTTRIDLKTNIGEMDHMSSLLELPPGTDITAHIRAGTDDDWVPFDRSAFQARLFNPWVDFRVSLFRASVTTSSPRFASVFLRYNRLADRIIWANTERTTKAYSLQEFGVTDDWTSQKFFFDNTLRSMTSEDWIANVDTGERWKINNAQESAPGGQLLSWDIDTHVVQAYDSQLRFPL
jgi:hypothetical protein